MKLEQKTTQAAKELVISGFIITYLFFTTIWLLPETKFKERFLEPVKFHWFYWGLDQNWSLFSPSIRDLNFHTTVTVRFKNGMLMLWEPPRMNKLDLAERFRREKFRKWGIDNLPWPDYKMLWPDLARHVGKKLYTAENPPEMLSLNLYWTRFPAPETKVVPAGELKDVFEQSTIFDYKYKPEDFR